MENSEGAISIIIPTQNKLPRLRLTLQCLIGQLNNSSELIIVDDASTDNTYSYLKGLSSKYENIKIIHQENPGGRSTARNRGIEAAKYPWLLFTDDDCLTSSSFVKNHLLFRKPRWCSHGAIWLLPFVKFFYDPENGVLFKEFEGKSVQNLNRYLITNPLNTDTYKKWARKGQYEKILIELFKMECIPFLWLMCTGGNICLEKEVVVSAGGFDEKLGKDWGAEDIELGYRLSKQGIRFNYLEEAPVYHMDHYRMNSKELSQKAILYMQEKHLNDKMLCNLYDDFFDGNFNISKLIMGSRDEYKQN